MRKKDENKSNPYRTDFILYFLVYPVLSIIRSRCTSGLIATPLKNTKAVALTLNNIEKAYAHSFKEFHQALTKFDAVGRCYLAGAPLPAFFR